MTSLTTIRPSHHVDYPIGGPFHPPVRRPNQTRTIVLAVVGILVGIIVIAAAIGDGGSARDATRPDPGSFTVTPITPPSVR